MEDSKNNRNICLFQLAGRYPDGWFELHIRTLSPPRLMIGRDTVTGKIHGGADINVKRPDGTITRVGSAAAVSYIKLVSVTFINIKLSRLSKADSHSHTGLL